MATAAEKRAAFHRLHESGCFAIPNPWDVGSAKYLQHLGFKAIATTSAGFAWSIGKNDNGITLDEVLVHLKAVAAATDIPVNADFEGGFADEPADVARNVKAAVATGIAGLSIEDSRRNADEPLYDFTQAVERIKAARHAIDENRSGALLTGRSEGFIAGRPDLKETIRRLQAYAEAGADCLFAPGIRTKEDISAIVKAVAPKPVNLIAVPGAFTVSDLAELGVRRISVGGGLARMAWAGFMQAAKEIAEQGSFAALAKGANGGELNTLFKKDLAERKH
jgi:2-methylisocitrate lyase-like PEP mutase family enzyme